MKPQKELLAHESLCPKCKTQTESPDHNCDICGGMGFITNCADDPCPKCLQQKGDDGECECPQEHITDKEKFKIGRWLCQELSSEGYRVFPHSCSKSQMLTLFEKYHQQRIKGITEEMINIRIAEAIREEGEPITENGYTGFHEGAKWVLEQLKQ